MPKIILRATAFLLLFIPLPILMFPASAESAQCSIFSESFSGAAGLWSTSNASWSVQNGKLNVKDITSGKIAYASASLTPNDYFTADTDVSPVSVAQSDGAYGIYVFTSETSYLTVGGKTVDGLAVFVWSDNTVSLSGWDVNAKGWTEFGHIALPSAPGSVGIKFTKNTFTARINGQDTSLAASGSLANPAVLDTLWLFAQGSGVWPLVQGTEVNFDNVCVTPFSTLPSSLPAPQHLRYTLSGQMLTINWDAVTGAGGYNLLLGFGPGSYLGAFDMGNITQLGPFDVSGASGTFYLAVQAYSGSVKSSNSNEIMITIGPSSGITAPQNFRYTLNGNMLSIQWDPVPGATGYTLALGLQSGSYIAGPVDVGNIVQLNVDVTGVVGTYYLVSGAYNGSQTSGYSNEFALKLGSVNPQPFDVSGVTTSLFGALGQFYNPNTMPAVLNTLRQTFQSGGLGAVDTLLTTLYPQIITKLPNGILVNYGNGFIDQLGDTMSGSITATHSNVVTSGGGVTGNYSVVVDNLFANGKFLADGSASGSFNFNFAPLLVGDITINGVLNAAGLKGGSSWPAMAIDEAKSTASGSYGSVSGSVHIDRNKCPNFPVSGSVTYTISGQTKTVTFNDNCNTSAYGITTGGGPVIISLTLNSGKAGDHVTIAGTGFGATQGSSAVTFAGTAAQAVSWSDTSIVAVVPNITSTGNVVVTVGGNPSNGMQFTILNQCSTQQVAGADTPETRVIDLGKNHGTFAFSYDTYTQQDRIIVSYQGTVLFDTGCVGASGTQNLSYSGASTTVTVEVQPNCAGGTGTQWTFTVSCP